MQIDNQENAIIADLGIAQKFKFMIHREKGGWDAKDIQTLRLELKREMEELNEKLSAFENSEATKEEVISECADVANYLAMIIEKVKK